MSLDPNGAPPGYYYQAGATAYIEDPVGTYSTGSATAPTIDPGGTYSGPGASAPTTDQAGAYSSPYALNRLFLDSNSIIPVGETLSFRSVAAVANYFGASSSEAALAGEFFAGYGPTPLQMLFANYPYAGEPSQLLGGDVTLSQLQNVNGPLSLTINGTTYTANVNLSGVQSFSDAATAIAKAFNSNLPIQANTAGDTITPVSVSFTGTINGGYLEVTSISKGGSIQLGSMISGTGIPTGGGAQIVSQLNGTPGGVGLYALLGGQEVVSSETMTESYGVLTVGTVLSGQIAVGEQVHGAGIASLTAIEASDSIARGPGSQWIVDIAQTVSNATAHILATPLVVQSLTGQTLNSGYFVISENQSFGYDNRSSTISYAGGGTAAGQLGLTQGSGATLSNPGGQTTNAAQFMNNLVQNENDQFGSFQVTQLPALVAQYDPAYQGDLANWAQSTDGQYPFLSQYTTTTPPAGSSTANADPAGTYSGSGASAPTPADPGTYIPVTGATSAAAEITDSAGAYSAAGASAPTLDPAGTWSGPDAGAPTPSDPGTYIPVTGATSAAAERLDPAGTYSAAGASAPTTDPAGTYSAAGASAPTVDQGGYYSAAGASAATIDPAGTYSSPYALNRLFLTWKNTTPDNAVLSFHSATAVANYYGAASNEAAEANVFFADYGPSATMMFTRIGIGRRPHLLGANVSNLTLSQLQSINGSLAITLQGWKYSGEVNLSGVTNFLGAAQAIQAALDANLPVVAVTTGSSITSETVSFTGTINHASLVVSTVTSGKLEVGAKISGPGIKPGSEIISQASGTPGGPGTYILFSSSGTVQSEAMTASYGLLTVGGVTSGTVGIGEQVTGAGVPLNTAILGNVSGSGAGSTWVVNNAPTGVTGESLTMTGPPLTVFLDWVNRSIVGATQNNDFFSVSVDGQYNYNENPATLSYASGTAAAALGLTQASGAIDTSPGGQHPTVPDFLNNLVENETGQFGSLQTTSHAGGVAQWAQSNPGFSYLGDTNTTTPAGSSLPTVDPAGTWSAAGATAPTLAAAGTYIPNAGATSLAAQVTNSPGYYSLAGASAETIDPAGTWSAGGASAPTLAAAGTYIPGKGATSAAAQIEDPAGSYSLAGASAPTLAQVGFYVPTAGASSETPDDPGYYTPQRGATAEILALPPIISGTVAGQSLASGQTDTPFSAVKIDDPNISTSETLSIQLTGGGGVLSDGPGFNGLTESAGVYTLSGNAGAVTKELDALVFTPNTFDAKTTFALVDTTLFGTTSLATSQPDSNTTVIVTNGEPVVASVLMYLADPSNYDGTPGGFDILGTAAAITANLDPLDDPNIDAITIWDNGAVGAAVQQLTNDATAISKLQNANSSPVLLAINDTATDIEAGFSALIADAGEIASITASNGPIVVHAATFLADQSALDKIVGGFDVSDKAANLGPDLDLLNDPNISAITVSDNRQISASVGQLTTDAMAIGNLQNANSSPVLLAIDDTAEHIETGLPTLVADAGEIGSIAASDGPVVVSAATALSDQSTLDKVVGAVDVSDTAANLVANLPALNADSTVAAITDFVGDATLGGGVGVNAPSFSEAFGANLTIGEALTYAGEFSQDSGSETAINVGDTFSLTGAASLSGETAGAGTLALAGGSATIESGATITTSTWMISGAGTDVTLDENLTYAGSFSEGAGDTFALSGGSLLLSGAASFAAGTVDGSNVLETEGTTTVSGLTIGGTVEWENAGAVNESGGSATIGDTNPADQAFLFNTPGAAYDILDDSGIGVGASTASYLKNGGLLEKTGGTGASAIASIVSNNGTLEVSSGTLDFQAGILSGTGSDIISGAATLEFDKRVSAGQTTSFTGSGGTLDLTAPATFAGVIGGFDTGAGSNDTIEVGGPFVFTGFTENAGGTQGSLGFTNPNTSAQISLTLLGDYNPANFVHQSGPHGSTLITYT